MKLPSFGMHLSSVDTVEADQLLVVRVFFVDLQLEVVCV
eukprot:CAMPEP_0206437786 /NCGR_PEP_ID=MMETSP0324_2-20121206/11238_1 /ASSEMBLY_ACC=CAM_ASM_000836 /TAXON_ID=2866 /ORGANISM="Crypthecodinium cohnii, Strain Seligo" /LENGTH=38 /DNA_ID= /DNA_START= /DNA_END= /DNA_ORIENTATION=